MLNDWFQLGACPLTDFKGTTDGPLATHGGEQDGIAQVGAAPDGTMHDPVRTYSRRPTHPLVGVPPVHASAGWQGPHAGSGRHCDGDDGHSAPPFAAGTLASNVLRLLPVSTPGTPLHVGLPEGTAHELHLPWQSTFVGSVHVNVTLPEQASFVTVADMPLAPVLRTGMTISTSPAV
jgi:hypothetical protein